MSANTTQQKAPWLLGVLLLSQVVLMSFSARHPDNEQSLARTWAIALLTPVVRGAEWVIDGAGDLVKSYVAVRGVRQENVKLQEEVDRLTEQTNTYREIAAQDSRLRAEYGVPSLPQFRRLAANVVSRDASLWFRRLIIDRGTLDGIALNMPVIAMGGTAGRIIQVGPNSATIQLITDRQAGVGGMLQPSGEMGEVRGLDSPRCELKDVSASVDVQVGQIVVTTGLDGIYPKGLTVGAVEVVENDPNAPWHKIVIKPVAPVDRLETVQVLLIEPRNLRMQESIK